MLCYKPCKLPLQSYTENGGKKLQHTIALNGSSSENSLTIKQGKAGQGRAGQGWR